jgi:acetyltransferase-like isoleucine patch superfamily enzyme
LHIYVFNNIFLFLRLFIITPYYNSILFIKLKKCGKNITIKHYDLNIIGHKYIEFGSNILIGKSLRLEAIKLLTNENTPQIVIGNNVQINDYCHFGSCKLIEIKDGCLIASRVFITDHFHGKSDINSFELMPLNRDIYIKGSVIINENCWIGEGVSIMPNITLGKNCIVGSNSVVTKSFPPNSIIAGNPAKIIRTVN